MKLFNCCISSILEISPYMASRLHFQHYLSSIRSLCFVPLLFCRCSVTVRATRRVQNRALRSLEVTLTVE
jgi:hypothetical protein